MMPLTCGDAIIRSSRIGVMGTDWERGSLSALLRRWSLSVVDATVMLGLDRGGSMAERGVPPLEERAVTDYTTLPPAYLEHLQRRMDEGAEQRAS
jgi:hypothetical protein